jgi:hypothetical protein
MRSRYLYAMALLVLVASGLAAAADQFLPESFAGWNATERRTISLVNGAPAPDPELALSGNEIQAIVEYGLTGVEIATYAKDNRSLSVTLFRMKDPTGAYGQFSYLRSPEMERTDFTDHSSISSDRALAMQGSFVLEVRGADVKRAQSDLKELMAAVFKSAPPGPLPTLWQRLPTDGIIEHTYHYITGPQTLNQFLPISSGDWLGFSRGAEAEFATYKVNDHDVTLLIADFPTPQIANEQLKHLEQSFNANALAMNSNDKGLFAQRYLTSLGIVYGARSKAEADLLLNQIETNAQVTWNEPTFQFTQPGWGTIIVGTIYATGLICIFALISGLAFGGVRLIVKRFLPDKVFDRNSDMQVLQLGLSSKPINAGDFYGIESRRSR